MATVHGTAMRCRLSKQAAFRPVKGVPRPAVSVRSTGWADGAATRAEEAMFGKDFGARDPTAAELESNFSDKVIGNWDTNHIIKIPSKMKGYIGLSAQSCVPAEQATLLPEKEVDLLKQQVAGWKVISNSAGQQSLRCEWRTKGPEAASELQSMISALGQQEGHAPLVTLSGEIVVAELTSSHQGGLTLNDFVVAAKINDLDTKALMPPPRKRFWA